MRIGVNQAGFGCALALAAWIPLSASADPGLKFEGEAWVPALALISSSAAEGQNTDIDPVDPVSLRIGAATLPASEAQGSGGDPGPDRQRDRKTVRAMLLIRPETLLIPDSSGRDGSSGQTDSVAGAPMAAEASAPVAAQMGLLVVSAGESAGGAAEPEPNNEIDRWVPAFAVYSGALVETGDAASRPGPAFEGPNSFPQPQDCGDGEINVLRCPASGSHRMIAPFVGASVEIMTPGVTAIPGSPRLFVHGGVEAAFPPAYDIAKESAPEDELTALGVFPPPLPFEFTIGGQGSRVTAETQTLMVNAGAGIAFTAEALGRVLRIKPSVEYKRETIELTGTVNRVVAIVPESVQPPFRPQPDEFPRKVQLTATDTQVYHGIGPGLEVEMDAGRAGPFMMTVFIGGKAYRFLGNRKFEFETSTDLGETVEFEFEKHRWAYEGGLGVRFRWLPE